MATQASDEKISTATAKILAGIPLTAAESAPVAAAVLKEAALIRNEQAEKQKAEKAEKMDLDEPEERPETDKRRAREKRKHQKRKEVKKVEKTLAAVEKGLGATALDEKPVRPRPGTRRPNRQRRYGHLKAAKAIGELGNLDLGKDEEMEPEDDIE